MYKQHLENLRRNTQRIARQYGRLVGLPVNNSASNFAGAAYRDRPRQFERVPTCRSLAYTSLVFALLTGGAPVPPPTSAAFVPGSRADRQLGADVLRKIQTGYTPANCKVEPVAAKGESAEFDPRLRLHIQLAQARGPVGTPWKESWEVKACDRTKEYDIIFVPVQSGGTYFNVSPRPAALPQAGLWESNMRAGAEAYQQGRYAEADSLLQAALTQAEQFGPEDRHVATSLNDLATLYQAQGRHAQAEPLYQRALGIDEKALGPDHPNVAPILDNLAGLYYVQGRHAQAEPVYQRALEIREKALGPEHPEVATTLNNLAKLYQAQGRYAQAEPLYQRALAIWEKALGPAHPDVATSLENIAEIYRKTGRKKEAEPLEKRAQAIRAIVR
jgi:tetratricopeptide (TPR) repeat protein